MQCQIERITRKRSLRRIRHIRAQRAIEEFGEGVSDWSQEGEGPAGVERLLRYGDGRAAWDDGHAVVAFSHPFERAGEHCAWVSNCLCV